MKTFFFTCVFFLACTAAIAQQSGDDSSSLFSVVSKSLLTDGSAGFLDKAMADGSKNANAARTSQMGMLTGAFAERQNTAASVSSAIRDGEKLVTFAQPQPVQKAVVEPNTRMYNPRLRINLAEYPAANSKVSAFDARLRLLRDHLQTRIVSLPDQIDLDMDGETLVLRGSVADSHQKSLAERVALLEPGIRSVKNELIVRDLTIAP